MSYPKEQTLEIIRFIANLSSQEIEQKPDKKSLEKAKKLFFFIAQKAQALHFHQANEKLSKAEEYKELENLSKAIQKAKDLSERLSEQAKLNIYLSGFISADYIHSSNLDNQTYISKSLSECDQILSLTLEDTPKPKGRSTKTGQNYFVEAIACVFEHSTKLNLDNFDGASTQKTRNVKSQFYSLCELCFFEGHLLSSPEAFQKFVSRYLKERSLKSDIHDELQVFLSETSDL